MNNSPRSKPKQPKRPLLDVLQECHECGFCSAPQEWDNGLIICNATLSYHALAREASMISRGCWHPGPGRMRWQSGQTCVYIYNDCQRDELRAARSLVRELTGVTPKWSFGNCATQLLKFSLLPVKSKERDKEILNGNFIGYHECNPGTWQRGVNYDCSSCYYQLISRLKSPRLGLDSNGAIEWFPLLANEAARWRDVLSATRDTKMLRNSIWGCMLGCTKYKRHFHNGEERATLPYEGHSFAAAALVARTAWELCQQAAIESNAVYAQTDGVVTVDGSVPRIWRDVQMNFRAKHTGLTDIQFQHGWACGGWATKWYRRAPRFEEHNPRPDVPPRHFWQEWLMRPGDNLLSREVTCA